MIPIAGPSVTEHEYKYVGQAMTDGWYTNAGDWVRRFEREMAKHCQRMCAVATNSCTAALHLALRAIDLRPGDQVIVPDSTWIATAAPVVYMGATPVFADIDPVTWCIDVNKVEQLITPRTRAIIGVDLYGALPDWGRLYDLAVRYKLWAIEDAAQAIGSTWNSKPAGYHGHISVFSFHGTKTMTTGGEGGMLLTDNPALEERIRYYQGHCRGPGSRMFWNTDVGYKYKMTDIQAAMGCAQLERLHELVDKKRQIHNWYRKHLDALNLRPNMNASTSVLPKLYNSYWMTTVDYRGLSPKPKEDVIAAMAQRGIACRPFFYPLSSLPAFADFPQCQVIRHSASRPVNVQAYSISPQAINLPSALCLTEEQVAEVCVAFKDCL